MTEDDWDAVMTWNNDPDVLYYSEGDNVTGWRLEDLQRIFRTISQTAYIFLVEFQGRVVGECWLQEMNLDWVRARFDGEALWRIDLALAKASWGRGIGTSAVGLLCDFGFGPRVGADGIVAAAVADDNVASQRCFGKNGFQLFEKRPRPPGAKSREEYYLMLTAREHSKRRP
jgi:RimJ/RimL family protein N-acetyltransferase